MEFKPVIAVKKYVMLSPAVGKLQPLFYADGTIIDDFSEAFPRAGDIFVYRDFDKIPDEVLEVNYERNPRISAEESPFYSQFATRSPDDCREAAERFCDLVEEREFPVAGGLITLPYQPTRYFFVRQAATGDIRGPFKRGEMRRMGPVWSVGVILPYPTDGVVERFPPAKYSILAQIPESLLGKGDVVLPSGLEKFQLEYSERRFVRPEAVLVRALQSEEWLVDAMPYEEQLSWARRLLEERHDVAGEDARRFRALVIELRKQSLPKPVALHQQRADRVIQALDDTLAAQRVVAGIEEALLGRFTTSDEGARFLERFVRDRRPSLLEGLRKEALQAEESKIDELRRNFAVERQQLERDLEDLEKKIGALQSQPAPDPRAAPVGELEALRRQINEAAAELERLRLQREDVDRSVQGLKDVLAESDSSLRKRLLEQKAFIDTLALPSPGEGEGSGLSWSEGHVPAADPQPASARECFQVVQDYFRQAGREIPLSQAANYLTAVVQNRISVFAGHPGVGKTSTVELLGRAIGLRNGAASRLLKVSVARGWVSSRDLVGVYNPLTQRFQPSATGVYEALVALDREEREGRSEADGRAPFPLWVLLDEMNLSPVEHYWSDFLTQADDARGSVRYGSRSLQFGPALRFIGTVNYDETTEPLSPRLISRAPVIYVEPGGSGSLSYGAGTAQLPEGTVLTMESLRPLWAVAPELQDEEQVAFEALVRLMGSEPQGGEPLGRPTIVSPRTRLAVARYCSGAREVIDSERGELAALDLAVSQWLLPMIRGSGEHYRRRLDLMADFCQKNRLPQAARGLRRLIERGEAYHEYDFFSFDR
ncbi:MAG: hypothetical protein ACYC5Y_10520 [Symbiobacteriia bacterium]